MQFKFFKFVIICEPDNTRPQTFELTVSAEADVIDHISFCHTRLLCSVML